MHIFSKFLEPFILGLISAAIPGPMLTTVFSSVLDSGFKQGFKITLKAMLAETIIVVLAVFIVFSLNVPLKYFRILSYVGAIVLIHLAFKIWKINSINNTVNSELFSFKKILLLTIFNGAFWIFWLTVCVPRALSFSNNLFGGQILFITIFQIAWLLMMLFLIYIFSKFRKLLFQKRLVSIVFKIFALLLVFFAIKPLFVW